MKRVAVVFYEGYISVCPTLINLVTYLSENGCIVDIFSPESEKFQKTDPLIFNVNIFRLGCRISILERLFVRLLNIFSNNNAKIFIDYFSVIKFKSLIYKRLSQIDYEILVGIDTIGIASLVGIKSTSKILYLSLEIDFFSNNNDFLGVGSNYLKRKLKNQEKKKINQINCIVIQDEERYRLLCSENNWSSETKKVIYLPNAPRSITKDELVQYYYFRKKFKLKDDAFIVLSAGMISEATLSLEIAKNIQNCNEYVLIFHERVEKSIVHNSYIKNVKTVGGEFVHLSLNPLPFNEIYKIYQDCQIGLVIYNPDYGENYTNIVYASGKLSNYLKFGKPIIANDLPGMREFIHGNGCGIVISDLSQLNEAILAIKANYIKYSQNSISCFNKHFNFDVFIQPINELLFND